MAPTPAKKTPAKAPVKKPLTAAQKKAAAAKAAQDKLNLQELQKRYGWVKMLIDTDPNHELLKLFQNATAGGWTEARFTAFLRGTKWYKAHSESYRNAELMRTTDPSQWNQRISQQANVIQTKAAQMGAVMTVQEAKDMAALSLQGNWNGEQLDLTIGNHIPTTPGVHPGGQAGQNYDDIKKLSADYLIPKSDKDAADWAVRIAQGRSTIEDVKAQLIEHAKNNWAFMAPALDAGQTVASYLDPYRQQAAQTLGIIPDAVDWTDPSGKWGNIFSTVDPKTGQAVPLSLADSLRKIKTDAVYGYDQSQPGKVERSGFAHQMLNMFGFNPGSG